MRIVTKTQKAPRPVWAGERCSEERSVEGEVALAYPANLAEEQAEGPAEDGGQDEADEHEAEPIHPRRHDGRRRRPASATSLGLSQPVQMPMGPQRPQVPMPEFIAAPFISSLNTQVAMGPVIMEVRMAGSQMRGF